MTGSEPTTMLVVAVELLLELPPELVPELVPELLPEPPHATVNAARERAPTPVRTSRPRRVGLMTLLISMISFDRWRDS